MVDPILFVRADDPGGEVTPEARLLSLAGLLLGATMGLARRLSEDPDGSQQPHLACVMVSLFEGVRRVYPHWQAGVEEIYALAEKLGYTEQDIPETEVIQ